VGGGLGGGEEPSELFKNVHREKRNFFDSGTAFKYFNMVTFISKKNKIAV
jgi:hypothetical protein